MERMTVRFLLCLAMVFSLIVLPGFAQDTQADTFSVDDLKQVERERDKALKRLKKLKKSGLKADRELTDIDADLIAAAADSRRREEAAVKAEITLAKLVRDEASARQRLLSDRETLEDVLATLMTFGSRRPPALASHPDDTAKAVRAAILMGDVAPKLKSRAETLAAEIDRLAELQDTIRDEQASLVRAEKTLAARRDEIDALYAEKRAARQTLVARTAELESRTRDLADQASSIRELLDNLANAAPSPPSLKPPAPRKASIKKTRPKPKPNPRTNPASPPMAGRGGPILAPVTGQVLRRFGEAPETGGRQKGETWRTRTRAQVVSPQEARVEFAGDFRSYGQILILDVGNGYLVVLAGLDSVYAETGQIVLAGEPVGRMASEAAPELYFEVRKDGDPIDPAQWMKRRT